MLILTFGHEGYPVGVQQFLTVGDLESYLTGEMKMTHTEVVDLVTKGRVEDNSDPNNRYWLELKDKRSPGWVKQNDPATLEIVRR